MAMARYLSQKHKKIIRGKHSGRFKMIRKDESNRYLESQPSIDNKPPVSFHSSTGFIFWVKMVKFFKGNGQEFSSKKVKRFVRETRSVRLKMLPKMSLPDHLESLPNIDN